MAESEAAPRASKKHIYVMLVVIACPVLLVTFVGFLGWPIIQFKDSLTQERKAIEEELNKIRSAGLPVTVEELDAWYPRVTDDRNAAILLEKAFEAIRTVSDRSSPVFLLERVEFPRSDQELSQDLKTAAAELVRQNQECLAYVHEALTKENCRFPVGFHQRVETELPHLIKLRCLDNMLALEALLATDAHDGDGAFAALHDAVRLPHALANEPVIVSQLLRCAMLKRFMGTLEWTLGRSHLSESQLQMLQDGVTREDDADVLFKALVGERCCMMEPVARGALLSDSS
jgi:hypothetical protein